MKTEVFLNINDTDASVKIHGKITAGSVGIKVYVSINGERWEDLAPVFVASCDGIDRKDVIIDGVSELPSECLISGKRLYIGVRGNNEDGTLVIPTVWADCKEVYPSTNDVDPLNVIKPSQDIVARILYMANRASENSSFVVEKLNSGELNGKDYTLTDEDILYIASLVSSVKTINNIAHDENGNIVLNAEDVHALPDTTKIPNVPSWAMEQRRPTYTAEDVGALPANTQIPPDLSDRVGVLEKTFESFVNEANELIGDGVYGG